MNAVNQAPQNVYFDQGTTKEVPFFHVSNVLQHTASVCPCPALEALHYWLHWWYCESGTSETVLVRKMSELAVCLNSVKWPNLLQACKPLQNDNSIDDLFTQREIKYVFVCEKEVVVIIAFLTTITIATIFFYPLFYCNHDSPDLTLTGLPDQ